MDQDIACPDIFLSCSTLTLCRQMLQSFHFLPTRKCANPSCEPPHTGPGFDNLFMLCRGSPVTERGQPQGCSAFRRCTTERMSSWAELVATWPMLLLLLCGTKIVQCLLLHIPALHHFVSLSKVSSCKYSEIIVNIEELLKQTLCYNIL